jgi:hypothetical protein
VPVEVLTPAAELKAALLALSGSRIVPCAAFSRHRVMNYVACAAFQQAIDEGKSAGRVRKDMAEAVRERGYRKLRGQVVALVGDHLFEVAENGSSRKRAIVKTVSFEYTTRGWFNLWVRKTGEQTVTTVRGDVEVWPTYEEDDFGTLYADMKKARRGEETSLAARDLAVGLGASRLVEMLRSE